MVENNLDYKEMWLTSCKVITIQNEYIEEMKTTVIVLGDLRKSQAEEIAGYKKILADNGFEV